MPDLAIPEVKSNFYRNGILLFALGAAILYWELLFIRWMGSCVRIVAYFSNFVLIAAFLGLGAGALLSRKKIHLTKFLIPAICLCMVLGPLLGMVDNRDFDDSSEYFWYGTALGVLPSIPMDFFRDLIPEMNLPSWTVLCLVFTMVAGVFMIFGNILGEWFGRLRPLPAYSFEIAGSLAGILLFALVSMNQLPPTIWFLIGIIFLFLVLPQGRSGMLISGALCLLTMMFCGAFERNYIWSPYYKIHFSHMGGYLDSQEKKFVEFGENHGYQVSVNNDYHQMIVNLSQRDKENNFFKSWRSLYDFPHRSEGPLGEGRILIVGAGTGNDVSAALRKTQREIDVVEIDPEIIRLGRKFHPEEPYSNPRVNIINDDARHYFVSTENQYAKVVFGFLDSHTLLSSYTSVRLDNFVYTQEALEKVYELLLPGGELFLTFASNREWIHERFANMLDLVFNRPTQFWSETKYGGFANGVIYYNKKPLVESSADGAGYASTRFPQTNLSTDDWPFLYLEKPTVPTHYIGFIIFTIGMSLMSLLLLPGGQRKIEMKYFFMGAGFFLIETSNIVKLSLLYGSTWVVNITVFSGILFLILVGNWTSIRFSERRIPFFFILLLMSCLLSYGVESKTLLQIDSVYSQGVLAILIFLGPIFFASIIFALLIRKEKNFYAVYGSNLLGAMVGGASEYLSLMMGFKFLILIAMAYYGLAWLFAGWVNSKVISVGVD